MFAEVSSHFPLAGSVFQWTKYLSRSKPYAWFSGWIYLWAGALTVAAVVATLPLTLIPMLQRHREHRHERRQPDQPEVGRGRARWW